MCWFPVGAATLVDIEMHLNGEFMARNRSRLQAGTVI
jgi:hypothetical protein